MCPACNARYDGDGGKFCAKDGTPLVKDTQQKVGDMVGQVLADRYRIIKLLGEGGMGQVYEAQHVNINKRFAIKLLRPEIVSNPEAVQRFRQEAWSASSIGHDNIIEIDDFATLPTGAVYLAMEYLAGGSLSDRMKKPQPLALGEALNIFAQVSSGLQAAHEKAIIHRDMKPENIFLASKHGHTLVKILDFGIAKVSGAESSSLTRTGAIFGTPHYMSPEQALGKPLDHRSDIYSVGVIMYEVFTGRVPFEAESFMGILTKHITSEPKRPTEIAPDREIPLEIENVILRAMAKEPSDRYASMAELMNDLVSVMHMYAPNYVSPTGSQPMLPPRSAPMAAHSSQTGRQLPIAPTMVATGAQADAIRRSQPPPGLRGPSQPVAATMTADAMGRPPTGPQQLLRGPSQSQPIRPATPPFGTPIGPSTGASEPIPYAYEEPPKKKSSMGLVLGLIGLLVAGGGAAAFVVFKKQPEAPVPVPETPKPIAAAAVVPVPQPTPPPRPSAPADERVIVDSLPPGAKIMKDGVQIGETPEDVRVPAGGTVLVTLHKDGFVDEPITVDPSKGRKLLVKLDKAHSSGGGSKESRKPSKASPVYSTPANLPRLKDTPAPVAATPPPKPEPVKAEPPKKHKPAADPYERLDDTPSRKGDVLNPY
jgi:serine/threonine-protein kinase